MNGDGGLFLGQVFLKIVFVDLISLPIVGQVINVSRLVLDEFQRNRLNENSNLDVSKIIVMNFFVEYFGEYLDRYKL